MCALATLPAGERMQAHVIAERAKIPAKFLEAILRDLRAAGCVVSWRGQQGGHALAKPAEQLRVGDLIRAIDGPLAPVRCASMTAYEPCADCADPDNCAVRALMWETRQALCSVLDQRSLDVLSKQAGKETWMRN